MVIRCRVMVSHESDHFRPLCPTHHEVMVSAPPAHQAVPKCSDTIDIHGALATVDVDCVRALGHRLMGRRSGNHNFVVRGTKRSEMVTFMTDHDAASYHHPL